MGEENVDKKPKEVIYRCKTECFFRNRRWSVGDEIVTTERDEIPEHFVRK